MVAKEGLTTRISLVGGALVGVILLLFMGGTTFLVRFTNETAFIIWVLVLEIALVTIRLNARLSHPVPLLLLDAGRYALVTPIMFRTLNMAETVCVIATMKSNTVCGSVHNA